MGFTFGAENGFGNPMPYRQEFAVRHLISKFLADESGATAIEYALIAASICLAIIVAVQSIGPTLNTKFTAVNTALQ